MNGCIWGLILFSINFRFSQSNCQLSYTKLRLGYISYFMGVIDCMICMHAYVSYKQSIIIVTEQLYMEVSADSIVLAR